MTYSAISRPRTSGYARNQKLASIRTGLRERNTRILLTLVGSKKPLLRSKCWELSKIEHEKGRLSKPFPVTKHDLSNTILSPRFCISEQHGLQEQKFRAIDDLSRSEVNATAHMADTYCPQDLVALVAHVRALSHVGAVDIRAWSVDFSNAYKTIASHEASNEAATVCFVKPTDNRPRKAQILVQSLGSRRAPENWGRVVTFIQFLDRELLALCVAAFFDDVFAADHAATETSGFWDFKRLSQLISFLNSDKKDKQPTTSLLLLGGKVAIAASSFEADATPERVEKIREHIAQALLPDTLTPSAATELRGGLGFYNPLMAGKLGRGVIGPLIARQYWQKHHPLNEELKRNLLWLYAAIGTTFVV